jgi:hypothetical protein
MMHLLVRSPRHVALQVSHAQWRAAAMCNRGADGLRRFVRHQSSTLVSILVDFTALAGLSYSGATTGRSADAEGTFSLLW